MRRSGVARLARRRRGRRPGGPAPLAEESPLLPLLRPLAASGPRLPPFLPSFPRASGPRQREAPRGAERLPPPASREGPRARHPARAPCEGGTGLAPWPAPDSSRAPPAPGGPRPPRPGGAVTGRAGRRGGLRGRRRPAAPSPRPRRVAGTCFCECACVCARAGRGRGPGAGRGPQPACACSWGGDFARWWPCSRWPDLGPPASCPEAQV